MAKATFGAGCFWHPQHVFDQVAGVRATWVGYMGGGKIKPTYEEVCTGATGHAEVVQLEYDSAKIGYEQLLEVFWQIHDPTQRDRQGPDIGSQYRSIVFFHDAAQEAAARAAKAALARSGKWSGEIVTAIEPAGAFWEAEDYHQNYIARMNRPSILSALFRRKKA